MERQGVRILIALGLIILGVVALLSNLNLLPFAFALETVFWSLAFGLGGLVFLGVFIMNLRDNWWAVIPGFTLIGLALLTGFSSFWNESGGALFLGMIGLSFWVIFFTHREQWWSIIPGGVLLTLAGVALLGGSSHDGMATGGLFFLGMAFTFLLVYLLAAPGGRRTGWALWPAGILGIMGALIMAGAQGMARLVWPAALILFGGFMVLRAFQPRDR